MDNQTLLIFGGIAALIYWYYVKVHTDEEGRVADLSVNVDRVLEKLDKFKPKKMESDFTEAQIQKQLKSFLLKHFVM